MGHLTFAYSLLAVRVLAAVAAVAAASAAVTMYKSAAATRAKLVQMTDASHRDQAEIFGALAQE